MNILLSDYSLSGHHLSFNRQFSRILLNEECRVFLAVPGSKTLAPWIAEYCPHLIDNFYPVNVEKNVQRNRFVNRSQMISGLHAWKSSSKVVEYIESNYQVKIDLVFFSWLDNHLRRYLHPALLDNLFRWRWSGLYFHPRHLRLDRKNATKRLSWRDVDSPILSKNCAAVCIHDRSLATGLQDYRYDKKVVCFPETADATTPDPNDVLAIQIRKRAKGRIVVGLIGCEPHKGLQYSLMLAKHADPRKFFFVFAGLLPIHAFSHDLTSQWLEFSRNPPENAFIKLGHIDEGVAYNSLFSSIDIHLMFYQSFTSSSNRLTKAAILKRLVLTDNKFCVGDDVRHFRLGKIVPEGNIDGALTGLDLLRRQIIDVDLPIHAWQQYSDMNSEAELRNSFRELLSLV